MGHLKVYNFDFLLGGLSSYYLNPSYLPFVPYLDEDLVQSVARGVGFHPLSSLLLLSYNCVLCIHKVLGRMDEFSHGLRLLLIKLMDE